jgi:sulfide:quinone oxidoreductase
MEKIVYITSNFAVTSALALQDFPEIARLGFRAVLSNRVDGEEAGQLDARSEAIAAWRAGLSFRHVPVTKHDVFADPSVEAMDSALRQLPGPILAHCKSGLRSAIVWAATSARTQSVDCVLAALAGAGYDLDFLRGDLEAQADRRRWLVAAPAADCAEPVAGRAAA